MRAWMASALPAPSMIVEFVVQARAFSTVMTPSLPTLSIALAISSPMLASELAEIEPTWAIYFDVEQGFAGLRCPAAGWVGPLMRDALRLPGARWRLLAYPPRLMGGSDSSMPSFKALSRAS
jgi:hypothetical protein